LPLSWFRRKKDDQEQRAPEAPPAPEVAAPSNVEPPTGPNEGEEARKKRRRGSRGGRNRRKPMAPAAAPEAKAEAPLKPVAKDAKTPERRSSSRSATRRRQPPRRAPLPAAKRELLVSVDVTEQRVAVLEDGRVAEVYLERPERRSIAGNIYKGVVDNVLPGMEAAFVEIGLDKNGFLFVDEIVGPELEGRRPRGRRITDLISRGEEVLVQAVKDPMKTKGARLTTEISLPGRFVVYVPSSEGLGVSRRLDEDERTRLRDIIKSIAPKQGGVIVRTAAERASAEDIARDLDFLMKLWKQIQARADESKAPALIFQEAELPLRVTRDLFTGDFERALVDDDLTLKRILGYLKKTSPHMAERVSRHREKAPLFEAYGVDAEIRSTLSRRVDLPSGGYLIFDYAEAFTVIDVNTGRFVGSRSKTAGARLEDTVTKNNLEAVKEVVRQLRLRDIGGIIVIDFIDMANPKNRSLVEEALQEELGRDRTKTYVVEISPLGLVEMTRQNVTEGPREILTHKCPTCAGEGVVVSEATAVVEAERRLRALVASKPRTKAFKVELNAHVAELLIGSAATRLAEIEAATKRRFVIQGKDGVPHDHFVVLDEGTIEKVAVTDAPVVEGRTVELKLVEVGRHDLGAGVGRLDGWTVHVGGAAKLVGKKAKVRIERVLDGSAYGTLVDGQPAKPPAPITSEAQAEKPTRASRAKKVEPELEAATDTVEAAAETLEAAADEPQEETPAAPAPQRKKTRRGSRGGRGRKKKPAVAVEVAGVADRGTTPTPEGTLPEVTAAEDKPAEAPAKKRTRRGSRGGRGRKRKPVDASAAATNGEDRPEADEISRPTIHVPAEDLGEGATQNGDEPATRRKTRRGSRGGRRRRKPASATSAESDQS
jgi:ribonuclease G